MNELLTRYKISEITAATGVDILQNLLLFAIAEAEQLRDLSDMEKLNRIYQIIVFRFPLNNTLIEPEVLTAKTFDTALPARTAEEYFAGFGEEEIETGNSINIRLSKTYTVLFYILCQAARFGTNIRMRTKTVADGEFWWIVLERRSSDRAYHPLDEIGTKIGADFLRHNLPTSTFTDDFSEIFVT